MEEPAFCLDGWKTIKIPSKLSNKGNHPTVVTFASSLLLFLKFIFVCIKKAIKLQRRWVRTMQGLFCPLVTDLPQFYQLTLLWMQLILIFLEWLLALSIQSFKDNLDLTPMPRLPSAAPAFVLTREHQEAQRASRRSLAWPYESKGRKVGCLCPPPKLYDHASYFAHKFIAVSSLFSLLGDGETSPAPCACWQLLCFPRNEHLHTQFYSTLAQVLRCFLRSFEHLPNA